jgi:uncharacterized protein (TIGR04255 family)
MVRRIPKRLQKEPLLEAVWEIRFATDPDVPAADVLPGMIYQAVRDSYPTSLRLPAADIPLPIAQQDVALRYVPTVRLEGPDTPFAIQVGSRVVTLNCRRPYAGWEVFSGRIRQLLTVLRSTGLITRPERFSLRYIDLIELDAQPSLASLAASLSLGGHDLGCRPVQVRTELHHEPFIHILQVASPVDVPVAGDQTLRGALVDIDTIHPAGDDFWGTLDERLDRAHDVSKQLFFDLLTPDAIERLEPVYE